MGYTSAAQTAQASSTVSPHCTVTVLSFPDVGYSSTLAVLVWCARCTPCTFRISISVPPYVLPATPNTLHAAFCTRFLAWSPLQRVLCMKYLACSPVLVTSCKCESLSIKPQIAKTAITATFCENGGGIESRAKKLIKAQFNTIHTLHFQLSRIDW